MSTYSSNIPRLYLIKIGKWFALTVPILMLYYQDCGLSSGESFTLKAVYSAIIIILEIPSGYMADALGRKMTLVFGTILGVVGMVIYALFGGFWSFLIAEVALGISQSLVSGADSAMMYDSLNADNRKSVYTKFEGRNTAIGNISESVAAILGGILAEVSFTLPFVIQSVIAFVAVPAALTLKEPPSLRSKHTTIKQTLAVVHDCVIKRCSLRHYLLFSSVIGACTLTMAWVYHPFLKSMLSLSLSQIGIVAALLNFIAAIFSVSAYSLSKKVHVNTSMWVLAICIPSCYLLISGIDNFWIIGVLAIFYVLRGFATPVLKDLVNVHTPSEVRATVLSIRNFVIRAVFVVVAPLLGVMTDAYSYQVAFFVLGIIFLVLAVSVLKFKRWS